MLLLTPRCPSAEGWVLSEGTFPLRFPHRARKAGLMYVMAHSEQLWKLWGTDGSSEMGFCWVLGGGSESLLLTFLGHVLLYAFTLCNDVNFLQVSVFCRPLWLRAHINQPVCMAKTWPSVPRKPRSHCPPRSSSSVTELTHSWGTAPPGQTLLHPGFFCFLGQSKE